MTNKVTKENLKQLGQILRNNKNIIKLDIRAEKRFSFNDNKKDFCNKVLELLEEGRFLQLDIVKIKGYFGQSNVSFEEFFEVNNIQEITLSEYIIKSSPKTLGEALRNDNYTLD